MSVEFALRRIIRGLELENEYTKERIEALQKDLTEIRAQVERERASFIEKMNLMTKALKAKNYDDLGCGQ